ncbi:MAG: DUF4878 domain-containing protein [Chitinophagaceae bacterium]|nr:DUF4878 domain-containing protein [Chitinophagaceae bacterium]
MKKIFYLSFLLFYLSACNNEDKRDSAAEDDVDAARSFIEAALDGNFDLARTYIVNDSLNNQDINVSERLYNERMQPEDKAKYKTASINIHEIQRQNDSTTIVHYSNTYRNQRDSLKVIRYAGKWLVDFKYIFKHKPDSLQ